MTTINIIIRDRKHFWRSSDLYYGFYYFNPGIVGEKFQLGGQTVDVMTKSGR